MTVAELIKLLEGYPQDLQVVYGIYSEQCLLEEKDVKVFKACKPRPDGWVQDERPDMESIEYLKFPN